MLILSVIVYLSLFVMMYICASVYSSQKRLSTNFNVISVKSYGSYVPITLAVLIYSIVFGMRFGVGTDHLSYYMEYQTREFGSYEVGYSFIANTFRTLGLPFPFYFGFIAFIQLFPFFFVFRKFKHDIYLYLVFALIFSVVWLSLCNGLRQWVAVGLIFWAFQYLNRKEWWKYILIVLFSTLFHTSAFVMLIMVPYAFLNPVFNNSKVKLVILAISVFAGYSIGANQWFDTVDNFLTLLTTTSTDRYDAYVAQGFFEEEDSALGIGYFLNTITCFAFIAYSEKAKSFYKNRWISLLFEFYFIGCCLDFILQSVHVLHRINLYLFGWCFVIYALSIYSAVKQKDVMWKRILILLVFLSFPANLYRADENTSQFYFYWWTDIMPSRIRNILIR